MGNSVSVIYETNNPEMNVLLWENMHNAIE